MLRFVFEVNKYKEKPKVGGEKMTVLVINHILNCVQICSGGRRYTCPTKEINGELFFNFKNEWHKVIDFTSKLTSEFKG